MLYGMADPIKEALRRSASACASTRRTANCCRAWRTSSAGCWRTRRTIRSCGQGFAEGLSEELLLIGTRRKADGKSDATNAEGDDACERSERVADGRLPPDAFRRSATSRSTDFAREREPRARCARPWPQVRKAARPDLPARHRQPAAVGAARRSTRVNPSQQARGRRPSRGRRRPTQAERGGRVAREGVRRLARHAGRTSGPTCSADWRSSSAQRRFELAAWEVYESGKPWREADADVAEAIDFCEYYAREMLRLGRRRSTATCPARPTRYFYEPRGVAVVIAPWNFPLAILTGMTAAALVTGNTVIMKPAEQSPVIGAKLMEVLPGGRPAAGRRQLPARASARRSARRSSTHPDVALIAFTGSLQRRPADQPSRPPRRRGRAGPRQARHRRDGRQERHHRRRRRRPRRGGHRRRSIAPSATPGQKCSACSRAIVLDGDLRRVPRPARRGDPEPARSARPTTPAASVGPVIDAEARDRILDMHRERASRRRGSRTPADVGGAGRARATSSRRTIFADVPPNAAHRPGGDLRPGAGGASARRTWTRRCAIANGTQVRPDRRPLLAQPGAHRSR